MKRIAFFCIPAHGHTNPMLPVAAELVRRGDKVRFYSFHDFEEKIKATGAEYVSCDRFLPEVSRKEEERLKKVSSTEMSIQDLRITMAMDGYLGEEFAAFQPDVVYSDSVCFWGKLNAWKHNVPLVVSTSTFAFNQMSSQYIKNSPGELADMILGLPKISAELKKMEPYGYHVKSMLSLVQSDNRTASVVYTSRGFQPYAKTFSDSYNFVGPSVFSEVEPCKQKERPLVYISMGTVINERPDFYRRCMDALGELPVDVILSCGRALDQSTLGKIPDNVQVYPYVNQLEVLAKADAFITHCGMNSVSESLYMAAPMLLYPQTNEQCAVAQRVTEIGAGRLLADEKPETIRADIQELLKNASYAKAAKACSAEFRSCPGPAGAADFIESAPHQAGGEDPMKLLNKEVGKFQTAYWIVLMSLMVVTGLVAGWKYVWIIGVFAGGVSAFLGKKMRKRSYRKLFGD